MLLGLESNSVRSATPAHAAADNEPSIWGLHAHAIAEMKMNEMKHAIQSEELDREWCDAMRNEFPSVSVRWQNGAIVLGWPPN